MNNSNIPNVPPAPPAPLAPGLPDRTVISAPQVNPDTIAVSEPVSENNIDSTEAVITPSVPSEIPVTYAEPVKFDVSVNPASPVAVATPPETPLVQPVSPIVGTDGPTNKMVRAAEVFYDQEPLNTDDLFKISDQLYPPTQDQ